MAAASTVAGSSRSDNEAAQEAIKSMENLERNYIAIIAPNTMTPMLHLKKYGECTLVDPRACINHYTCAADLACILYAHVSLRYFHYMVHSGYISNKTKVVLHDTINDTYVFAQVENAKTAASINTLDVDKMIENIRNTQGQCRPGIDVLQAGTDGKIGYIFTQPLSVWKKTKSGVSRSTTTKVLSRKEWMKRIKTEKEMHDCQRTLKRTEELKKMAVHCQPDARKSEEAKFSTHIPVLVIERRFDSKKPDVK